MVIDTCSLLFLARDLLPLDKNKNLFKFIKSKFDEKKFMLLDSVYQEAKHISKGIILQKFDFLKAIKKEENLALLSKDHNTIDNNWIAKGQRSKLQDNEYGVQKTRFIESADCQLILYAKRHKYSIITQESKSENDNKLFKKIPIICGQEQLKYNSATDYLANNNFILDEN